MQKTNNLPKTIKECHALIKQLRMNAIKHDARVSELIETNNQYFSEKLHLKKQCEDYDRVRRDADSKLQNIIDVVNAAGSPTRQHMWPPEYFPFPSRYR